MKGSYSRGMVGRTIRHKWSQTFLLLGNMKKSLTFTNRILPLNILVTFKENRRKRRKEKTEKEERSESKEDDKEEIKKQEKQLKSSHKTLLQNGPLRKNWRNPTCKLKSVRSLFIDFNDSYVSKIFDEVKGEKASLVGCEKLKMEEDVLSYELSIGLLKKQSSPWRLIFRVAMRRSMQSRRIFWLILAWEFQITRMEMLKISQQFPFLPKKDEHITAQGMKRMFKLQIYCSTLCHYRILLIITSILEGVIGWRIQLAMEGI